MLFGAREVSDWKGKIILNRLAKGFQVYHIIIETFDMMRLVRAKQ